MGKSVGDPLNCTAARNAYVNRDGFRTTADGTGAWMGPLDRPEYRGGVNRDPYRV